MLTITFTTPEGDVLVETTMTDSDTVMEVAVREGVPGIVAECGGSMSCATCHVYLEPEANESFEPQEQMERDLIEGLENCSANSRLSCQLYPATPEGEVVVTVPDSA